MIDQAITHITEVAKTPSFSSYEERLHPYVHQVFEGIESAKEIEVEGNNLIYQFGDNQQLPTIALTAHLDKINHYGREYPNPMPVTIHDDQVEGAMDDSAGVGMVLTLAEQFKDCDWVNLLFFFSEMEEKKGLEDHPELIKNNGKGFKNGMGARRISQCCIDMDLIPEQVITIDTTPLFEGKQGVALYANHWELNGLKNPSQELIDQTSAVVKQFLDINPVIKVDNNTNDYLHYGEEFNNSGANTTVSVALEPSIYPYHQKGERVYIEDISRCLNILEKYIDRFNS